MRAKKTKGKQKISIRRIEKDEDRLVTFSKRRNGIHTKLSELSILCGAEVGFLLYSGAGKPYTFGSPSFDTVAKRFLDGEGSSSSSTSSSSIVDAHRKVKLEELCKKYNLMAEKADEEEALLMEREAEAEAAVSVEKSEAWWKADPKEDEDAMQLLKKYEELYAKLFEVVDERKKSGGGDDVASSYCIANNHSG